MTALTYNPDTPPERQISSWACSIRTTTWILRSLGIDITAAELQDEMVPDYVTPDLGLLDGRGVGLADIVRHHLPAETPVEVLWAPSWGDVMARAGRGPIGIGSGSLYHWLNVAKLRDDYLLSAPNPAPNYPPGAPLGDTLSLDEFNQYAPWALVFVDASPASVSVPGGDDPAPPPVVVPPAPPRQATFNVGTGILAEMLKNGEAPASDEIAFGTPGRGWACAVSSIGRTYTYVMSTGQIVVVEGWGAS